jgi:hypothetical protein
MPSHPVQFPVLPRRRLLAGAGLWLCAPLWVRAEAALPSIAVLPLDFIDDHENPATVDAQKRRLKAAYIELQQQLEQQHLYRVVDFAPAQPLLDKLLTEQTFMYRCPDCAVQIGQALNTDLVMTSWVQKVSELILNFNVEIYRVSTQRSLMSKSVDMRGNNDVSWQRSVRYLVQDMADKRAQNPRYGL